MVVTPPAAAGLLVQMDLGRLECTPPSGVLKISLAGANNLVPTTGLTPCIIIVHVYTCNYSGAEKKKPTPAGISWHLEWLHSANSTPLHHVRGSIQADKHRRTMSTTNE